MLKELYTRKEVEAIARRSVFGMLKLTIGTLTKNGNLPNGKEMEEDILQGIDQFFQDNFEKLVTIALEKDL